MSLFQRIILLSGAMLIIISVSLAQKTVTGTVLDKYGDAMPFATVQIKDTTIGTTTDIDGNFSLSVNRGDTLIISVVGFERKQVTVDDRDNLGTIVLMEDIEQLEEIVVVGYGTVRKEDLTGSVAVLDREKLTQFPVANIAGAIQGQLSGVQVVNSAEPGTNPQILIRGVGTMFGNTNPLVVIDGLQTGVGALGRLDPASIESFQVLKDASASAIYGSRAANGVIIITTKKGTKNTRQINISHETGVQMVANQFDLMNATEYAEYTSRLYVNSSTGLITRNPPPWTQSDSILSNSTDWQDVMFKRALTHKSNLSVSGGGDHSTYFFGLGYLNQDGIIQGTSFERFNLQLNSTHKMGIVEVGQSLNIFRSERPQTDLTSNPTRLYEAAPQMRTTDPNNLNGLGSPLPAVTGANNVANPLAYAFRSTNTINTGLLSNIYAEIELPKGFSIRSDLNIDYSVSDFERFREPLDQSQAAITRDDYEIQLRNTIGRSINSETLLKYEQSFDEHRFSAMAGYSVLSNETESIITSANNVAPGTQVPQTGENVQGAATISQDRLLSQLARVNYSFNGKYLFTASVRRDGSSRFGENNRWGVFPSFSVGWQLGDEQFLQGMEFLNQLKLRGGYGELGNPIGDFRATLNSEIRYPWISGSVQGVAPRSVPNPNLKWETVTQINLGIDAGLFDNKLQLTLDWYKRVSEDMIIQVPIPQFTGIIDSPFVNLGGMNNTGMEVEIKYNKNVSNDFSYSIGANATFNRNELTKLDNQQDTLLFDGTLTTVGEPVAVHYGWVRDGIDLETGVQKFVDTDGDGQDTGNDRVVLGSPHPTALLGINLAASYKGFDVSMFFQGAFGHQIMNQSSQDLGSTHADRNRLSSVLNNSYDEELNPDGTLPIISLRNDNNNDRISDRFIEDGDYIRARNLQIGYDLKRIINTESLTRMRVYFNAVNLFTITKYTGLDPDISNNGDVFLLGRDTYRYPPVRSFNLGIQIDL